MPTQTCIPFHRMFGNEKVYMFKSAPFDVFHHVIRLKSVILHFWSANNLVKGNGPCPSNRLILVSTDPSLIVRLTG